jgi:hypothetical protein
MSFAFAEDLSTRAANKAQSDLANNQKIYQTEQQQKQLDRQKANQSQLDDFENQQSSIDNTNRQTSIEIARQKAQKRLDNAKAGIEEPVDPKTAEANMTDFERAKQLGDYGLDNQIKAWGAANRYRMSEADQSNIAQKDRLGMQLDTQKSMQDKTIAQENRLRRDDFQRAIQGFKGSF